MLVVHDQTFLFLCGIVGIGFLGNKMAHKTNTWSEKGFTIVVDHKKMLG